MVGQPGNSEVDFPRGGNAVVKRKHEEGQSEEVESEEKKKRKLSTGGTPKRVKDESMWTTNVTEDMFIEGLLGVGVVHEVFEDRVLLETLAFNTVELSNKNISKLFSELSDAKKIKMEDAFQLGQMVPFRVLSKKSKEGKKTIRPKVTCDPAKLNGHLSPAMLSTGLVFHSTVTSIEEKGAILDIGMDLLKGFVEKGKQPQGTLIEGQPLLVRIESVLSRIVRVSALVEQENLGIGACEKLKLNHLMPGTILECEPTDDEPTASGIMVSIGNGLRGVIQRRCLPPRLRENTTNLGKAIRAVVMLCQQNSNILVLSAHQDIVAVSKPERRTDFAGISIGDKIRCKVFDVIASKHTVYFTVSSTEDKKLSFVGLGLKNNLDKPDDIEKEYKLGNAKDCRVIGKRYAERCLILATRRDIFKQPLINFEARTSENFDFAYVAFDFLNAAFKVKIAAFFAASRSFKGAVCGEILEGKVVHSSAAGVHLNVCNFVRAFLPASLVSSKMAKNFTKKLTVDTVVKCKVWDVKAEKKQIIVTSKEEVVNSKCGKIKSLDDVSVGAVFPCFVTKIFDSGVLLLRTFRNLCGVLPRESASQLKNIKLNDFVEAKVESLDKEAGRIKFGLTSLPNQKSFFESTALIRPKAANHFDPHGCFTATVKSTNQKESVCLNVAINGEEVEAFVENHLLFDSLRSPCAALINASTKNLRVESVTLLGSVGNFQRATTKRSIGLLAKSLNVIYPQNFEDLSQDMVVLGVVHQRNEVGIFVEVVGGSGLLTVVYHQGQKLQNSACEAGQVLVGKVSNMNNEKKLFHFNLASGLDGGKDALKKCTMPLLKSVVDEITWAANCARFPPPGSVIETTLTKEMQDAFVCQFKHGKRELSGILYKDIAQGVKCGKKTSCVVIDVNFDTSEVFLALEKFKEPRIVAVRKDYICSVTSQGIVFTPSRLHPNHTPTTESLKVGDAVEIKSVLKYNNVLIGHRVDDENLAETFCSLLEETESTKKVEEKSESAHFMVRSIKNFEIYNGVVVGEFESMGSSKNSLFAKISLPGGNFGRLHVSELPSNLLKEGTKPLAAFIARNSQKEIIVRVIGFFKASKTLRIAELTMKETKIKAAKVRARNLGYQTSFKVGEKIACFGTTSTGGSNLKVEINDFWMGSVLRENVAEDMKTETAKGGIVDLGIERGEMRWAQIVSVNKNQKSLNLTLDEAAQKNFTKGVALTGRVFSVSDNPLSVLLSLSTGQQAILSPTAVTDCYENAAQMIAEQYSVGEIVEVVALRTSENPKRYFVATKVRYEQGTANKDDDDEVDEKRRLVTDWKQLERGSIVDGFVCKIDHSAVLIEVGPGFRGHAKNIEPKQKSALVVNSVVSVKVTKINANNVEFSLERLVEAAREPKGKEAKSGNKKVKKEKEDEVEALVDVEMADPGFDWSNSGFRNEDLAIVGKLLVRDSAEEDKNTKKKEKKRIISEEENLTEEEFSKMLRNDPNSAVLWIRYMSFFLEKENLKAARATAERALETINYREIDEMFNMWTAFLNMEVAFGDAASVQAVFERACGNADSYKIHKQLASIYENANKPEEARELYEAMVKKFRSQHMEVWNMLAENEMKNGRQKEARDLLQRALASVPKQQHTTLISKFAQLEFKQGDKERAKTLFEGLVNAYPKKAQLWLMYADAAQKFIGIDLARAILERACNEGSSMHLLRPLYKKWLEVETRHGDEQAIELVRAKAEKYLQSVADTVDMEE